jgi:hypothetical protein
MQAAAKLGIANFTASIAPTGGLPQGDLPAAFF